LSSCKNVIVSKYFNFADTRFAGRASFDDATFAAPGVAFGFMKAVFYKGVTGLLENPCF
jgi:hypothetical protein